MSAESSVEKQRQRYDKEAEEHHLHYQDEWTQRYRDEFYRSNFADINLEGKQVLDAMCASGIETGYLLGRGASVVGLDISPENARLFEERWSSECKVESIHQTSFADAQFDVVYIMGGLHHVLPLLDEVIAEVHRILKPGGYFFFIEPNKDTWVNRIRDFWYKRSSRFADEEQAISYNESLLPLLGDRFAEIKLTRGGNVAYLLVAQSLILGVPASVKSVIASTLFKVERFLAKRNIGPTLFFAAIWQRRA